MVQQEYYRVGLSRAPQQLDGVVAQPPCLVNCSFVPMRSFECDMGFGRMPVDSHPHYYRRAEEGWYGLSRSKPLEVFRILRSATAVAQRRASSYMG